MHYANQLSQNTLLVATIKEYAACVHPCMYVQQNIKFLFVQRTK